MLQQLLFAVLSAVIGGIIFALAGQSVGFILALLGWHFLPGNVPVIWAAPFIAVCVGTVLAFAWGWRTASKANGRPSAKIARLLFDGFVSLAFAYAGGLLTAALIFGVLWLVSPLSSKDPIFYLIAAPFGAMLFGSVGWKIAPSLRSWAR